MFSKILGFRFLMIVICITLRGPYSYSQEHGGGAPPAEKSGAAGHGGDSKKDDLSPMKERPWVEVENKLGLLRSKRDALAAQMKKAREERDHAGEGTPQYKEKMKEYLSFYKQWLGVGEDYNKLIGVLKYRYPERVLKGNKKLEKMEHKSAEELDAELGIDGKLNKSLEKVKSQFGAEEVKKQDSHSKAEKLNPKSESNTQDSLSSEPQIILRK